MYNEGETHRNSKRGKAMDELEKKDSGPQSAEAPAPEKGEAAPEQAADGAREKRSPGRILRMAVLILVVYAAVAAAVTILVDGRHVRFYLTGEQELTVPYGEPFTDPGCYAVTAGRIFGEGEQRLPVETEGRVDTDTPGTYQLRYNTRYQLLEYSTVRVVHVADMTPPVITLQSREGYAPSWFTGYEEEGYKAVDNLDGDLTAAVTTRMLDDGVEYSVTDAAGNTAAVVRHPNFTVTRPHIDLNGGADVEIPASLSFTDPGYAALDTLGNDLTGYVRAEGDVIPWQTGDYTRTYSITNDLGETVSATRTIHIVPVQNPDTVEPDGRVIYLTFDDGPGPYTERLLDLLARYNVKATFFVTCANPEYFHLVGRAFREGHSIGVHTASHNYYEIYASEEAFFDDFNQVEDMIYQQTGTYTALCRFPGGSSNTVSSFNPGIITRLARSLTDMGYKYFDWNVASGDAGETTRTTVIVDNIIDGCTGRKNTVVLQHDIKDYSVAAVEKVLVWGLRSGYTFLPLDRTSPDAHHDIAN
ncbi:MAG: polysaccharide deacetylase [Oscillospiraceae bacterium]|nr:polysaccharide deacetylase [Oscillospiraceae bacterium]